MKNVYFLASKFTQKEIEDFVGIFASPRQKHSCLMSMYNNELNVFGLKYINEDVPEFFFENFPMSDDFSFGDKKDMDDAIEAEAKRMRRRNQAIHQNGNDGDHYEYNFIFRTDGVEIHRMQANFHDMKNALDEFAVSHSGKKIEIFVTNEVKIGEVGYNYSEEWNVPFNRY